MRQNPLRIMAILSLGLLIGLTGCKHDPADDIILTAIKLDKTNVKTIFTVGDEFTTDGLVVTAVYSDETTKEVTDFTASGNDLSKAVESQIITISYTENGITVTETYTIVVKETTSDSAKKDNDSKDSDKKDPVDPENTGDKDPEDPVDPVPPEPTPAKSSFDITLSKNNEIQMTFSSVGKTVSFEVPDGYKSYAWYLNGNLKDEKSNKFSIETDQKFSGILANIRAEFPLYEYADGLYEVLVVVEDSNSEYYSATATFIIQNNYYKNFN